MEEAVVNYLLFMICVLITVLVISAIIVGARIIWDDVIEPIVRKIKRDRDNATYWENRYEKEFNTHTKTKQKYIGYLKTLDLTESVIESIIPGTIQNLTSHDDCADHEERCMITFTVDTNKLWEDNPLNARVVTKEYVNEICR